jgi:transposase
MEKSSTRRQKDKPPVITKRDQVYVGLDVHKLSVHAAVRINGTLFGAKVLPAKAGAVLAFLAPFRAGLKKVVYEAGPTGYAMIRALIEDGVNAAIVSPGKIPRPAVQGAKSDGIDCRMLAEFAEKDLLSEVAVPTLDEDASRQIQRMRDGIRDRRRKAKQHIRSFLLYHGIEEPKNLASWGESAIDELQKIPMSPKLKFCLDILLEDLYHALDQMEHVNERLKVLASEKRYAKEAERLKTHPGVGDTTCIQVLTELYQPERFENSKQVAAYVGLAPQVRQSGQTRTEGALLKAGRGELRCTLLEAAWVWIRVEKRATKLYGRLVRNTGNAQKAIVAMARRMLVNLWYMLIRKEDYRPFAAK